VVKEKFVSDKVNSENLKKYGFVKIIKEKWCNLINWIPTKKWETTDVSCVRGWELKYKWNWAYVFKIFDRWDGPYTIIIKDWMIEKEW
jgi:hypothetical protein